MTVSAVKALIQKMIEVREQEIEELKGFLEALEATPQPIQETPEAEFLSKGSQVYARILKDKNEVGIYPIESLQIKVNDAAISWLQNKVFEKAAAKHGFQYQFVNRDGFLEAIKVRGQVSQEEIDKLLNATKWAFEKASNRQ